MHSKGHIYTKGLTLFRLKDEKRLGGSKTSLKAYKFHFFRTLKAKSLNNNR